MSLYAEETCRSPKWALPWHITEIFLVKGPGFT